MPKKKTLLIPAMLDFHFPLLKYAFCSGNYDAVILEDDEDIVRLGLKYVHNDMCFPLILITGQFISALKSGKYPPDTMLMIPQAGDACRGSNYIHIIRKALKAAGFSETVIISLNVSGLEKANSLKINIGMVRRGIASVMYGDILMILRNQTEPFEKNRGETLAETERWFEVLRQGISDNTLVSSEKMKKTFAEISDSFARIKKESTAKPTIGIVGELYVKYCHLGNGNICSYLRKEGCGIYINGFSWYLLYYLDTHLMGHSLIGKACAGVVKYLSGMQSAMTDSLRQNGFLCCEPFREFKKYASDFVSFNCGIADGWLIGAEIVGIYKSVTDRIACVQPFGCMPSHVFGRGIYSAMARRLDGLKVSSIDFDSGSADVNLKNRLSMLINL